MGPPAYEFANLFMNPWNRPAIVFAAGRAKSLALLLSAETGCRAAELINWAIAHTALAATWCISTKMTVEHPLKVLDILIEAQGELA